MHIWLNPFNNSNTISWSRCKVSSQVILQQASVTGTASSEILEDRNVIHLFQEE
jgi:hypothetical protein